MTLIDAFVLGIIQGLTEFLPVSSSGHIELGKAILGVEVHDGLLFTILLHFATAISTILVFWKEIKQLLGALFRFKWNAETRYALLIVLSMIPAAAVGLLFEDRIDAFFEGNIVLVSLMLLLTGAILFASDRIQQHDRPLNAARALGVGLVQAIAILPGISRSGSTIAAAVLLKVDRSKAARFSFLMVLPLILGAMASKGIDFLSMSPAEQAAQVEWGPVIMGFSVAMFSGYYACQWMIGLVRRSQLRYFAYYCWTVGIAGLIWTL